jgi:hypothetical protein
MYGMADGMDEIMLERVRIAASDFRAAIEKCDKRRLGIEFEDFPRGSCGVVTQLLGKYLRDRGLGDFRYVSGWRRREGDTQPHSHAWLRQSDIIVDITADQFGETLGPVVVTSDSRWHDAFKDRQESNAWDERTHKSLFLTFALNADQLPGPQTDPD